MTVEPTPDRERPLPAWPRIVVALAAAVGLALLAQAAVDSSATYDEVAYMRIASDWWRRGETVELTRIGSPITFFKLHHGPAFLVLDAIGLRAMVDDPIANQAALLPMVRLGSLWIWLAAFGVTVAWSRSLYGPKAMALAAVLFAISPNLIAHGSLATMEMPRVAATAGTFFLFWRFLATGRPRDLVASAAVAGLAFACKFTAVLYPPMLGLVWLVHTWRRGERRIGRTFGTLGAGVAGYLAIMIAADLLLTGGALLKASPRTGDHPSLPSAFGWLLDRRWPQDWVGLVNQLFHQRNGGPSYLLGERRMTGWWYYYPVALAVKVPLGCWLLLGARGFVALRNPSRRMDWMLPLAIGTFLAVAMVGSKRNYGVRYMLPMAPLAVVWISGLAARAGRSRPTNADAPRRWLLAAGLALQTIELASCHPHELSFFNRLACGTIGGRKILADSNLDWGQGLRSFARIEARYPDMTLFYFGDTDPAHYGVKSHCQVIDANWKPGLYLPTRGSGAHSRPLFPTRYFFRSGYSGTSWSSNEPLPMVFATGSKLRVPTRYLAVSASLQHGPWGPPGYFGTLNLLEPIAYTDDGSIAVYDVGAPGSPLARDQ